ncbi:hypothetical protein ABUK73_19530, partial [Agrobacterium sp. BA1120]|uniref:hypothetical protein n=1 Tax=Agrobacterium sp. BA1120 TaxID=3228927 RepID=UPI00336AB90F
SSVSGLIEDTPETSQQHTCKKIDIFHSALVSLGNFDIQPVGGSLSAQKRPYWSCILKHAIG